MARETHSFKLKQGGVDVAGVSGPNVKRLVTEACHCLFMYRQYGRVKIAGTPKFMDAFKAVPGSAEYL